MMTGPLLALIKKLAVQNYTLNFLKSIHQSYNIPSCFPIMLIMWTMY